jgi:hypothetical protein
VKVRSLAIAYPLAAGAIVPVILEIDGASLLRDAPQDTVAVEILMYAFDGDGRVQDFTQHRFSFDSKAAGQKISQRGIRFYGMLRLDPGEYSIRVLVREATGTQPRLGFDSVHVRVPISGEAFLSQPFLLDQSSGWMMLKAPEREPTMPDPLRVGEVSLVPSRSTVVSHADETRFAVFARDVASFSVRATFSGSSGDQAVPVTLLGRAPGEASEPARLVYTIQAPSTAGKYALTIVLKPADGVEQTTTIPVEVN